MEEITFSWDRIDEHTYAELFAMWTSIPTTSEHRMRELVLFTGKPESFFLDMKLSQVNTCAKSLQAWIENNPQPEHLRDSRGGRAPQ